MRLKLILIAALLTVAPMAFAGTYTLNDWCFYVGSLNTSQNCNDGFGSNNFASPVSAAAYDYALGDNNTLGNVVVSLTPGTYSVFAIFDYDITALGGFNEFANTSGSLASGQHFSVDAEFDPSAGGGITAYTPGWLWTQFTDGALDDTNHLTQALCASAGTGNCEDVAVALSWLTIVVPGGNTGTVTFRVASSAPSSGFYVTQTDLDSGENLYLSSDFTLNSGGGGGGGVPEPSTLGLMGMGVAGLFTAAMRRRRA